MKTTYVIMLITFVFTVIGIFIKEPYINIFTALLILITTLLVFKTERRLKKLLQIRERFYKDKMGKATQKTEKENYDNKIEAADFESKYQKANTSTENTHKLLLELELTIPIIEKLSRVIIDKSEESTMNTTEKVFSISSESQEVSIDIQKLLSEMTVGDQSLESGINKLQKEVGDFNVLVEKVQALKKSYVNDMVLIEKTVTNIKKLTSSISDIADQTNILAINASIESARAGKAGAGFAVIAGETQRLAKDSKETTEKITKGIKEIAVTIAGSFQRQSETLNETINHLQESKESFLGMSQNMAPQIRNITSSVEQFKDLSETITSKIKDITVSLQYQDATRQILEHIIQLIKEVQNSSKTVSQETDFNDTVNRQSITQDLLTKASNFFTVREEWIALGIELDENQIKKDENIEELQGDITLF